MFMRWVSWAIHTKKELLMAPREIFRQLVPSSSVPAFAPIVAFHDREDHVKKDNNRRDHDAD